MAKSDKYIVENKTTGFYKILTENQLLDLMFKYLPKEKLIIPYPQSIII